MHGLMLYHGTIAECLGPNSQSQRLNTMLEYHRDELWQSPRVGQLKLHDHQQCLYAVEVLPKRCRHQLHVLELHLDIAQLRQLLPQLLDYLHPLLMRAIAKLIQQKSLHCFCTMLPIMKQTMLRGPMHQIERIKLKLLTVVPLLHYRMQGQLHRRHWLFPGQQFNLECLVVFHML